jgi:PAS domain S-box-containing protein
MADAARDRELSYALLSLELALDPCFRVGYDERVQALNPAASALLGLSADELVGRPLPFFDEAYAQDLLRRQAPLRRQGTASFETVLRHKDGHPVPLEVSASHLCVDDQDSIFASCRDLRPRQELQDRLLQVEKLESISDLVGGVAHDFNNLLAIFMAGLDQVRPPEPDPRFRLMDQALERATSLVRRLLAFARRRALQTQPQDLAAFMAAASTRWKAALGPAMELRCELADGLPQALVDLEQLDELILNLALNARDACQGRGAFTLQIEPQLVGMDAARALGVQPGPYLCILASDDGPGVPANIAARIFDPFFTTKAPGQGAGLGLASAYGIARQHGGRLELLAGGPGARFKVLLPQAPSGAAQPNGRTAHAKGSLLLVDDESGLVELLAPALGRQGYQVGVAGNGEEALAQWAAQGGFDLLVTDLRMPGLDGHGLARRLREQRPGLPVLFISGWSPETPEAGQEAGTQLLVKPFRLAELYQALEALRRT